MSWPRDLLHQTKRVQPSRTCGQAFASSCRLPSPGLPACGLTAAEAKEFKPRSAGEAHLA